MKKMFAAVLVLLLVFYVMVSEAETPKVGDIMTFGRYEQDNDLTNGPEPIEWIVLDVQGSKAFLLSKYGLDAKAWDNQGKIVGWEKCSLREWLNRVFWLIAFSPDEQAAVLTTTVKNDHDQSAREFNYYEQRQATTYPDNDTEDKLFLLSAKEAFRTYCSEGYRITSPTKYAVHNGAYQDGGHCWWLLRTRMWEDTLFYVRTDGKLQYLWENGKESNPNGFRKTSGCVRPAMWIDFGLISTDGNESSNDFTLPFQAIEDPSLSFAIEALIPEGETWDNVLAQFPNKPIGQVEVGTNLLFGAYPQGENGELEQIEWLVLDVQDEKALLLSRYGLDAKQYHTKHEDVTWENSSLRTWLNRIFFNTAFSKEQQDCILVTTVDNSKNQHYRNEYIHGISGNDTQDRVFLLSYAEAKKYFGVVAFSSKNKKSRVEPTAFAIRRGVYTSSDNQTTGGIAACMWWLRSPIFYNGEAFYVSSGGGFFSGNVYLENVAVRPVMWLDLSKIQ